MLASHYSLIHTLSSSTCSVIPKRFIWEYPSASFMMLHNLIRSTSDACEHKCLNRQSLASPSVSARRILFSTLSGIIPLLRASRAMAAASTHLLKSLCTVFSTSSENQRIGQRILSGLRQRASPTILIGERRQIVMSYSYTLLTGRLRFRHCAHFTCDWSRQPPCERPGWPVRLSNPSPL